MFQFLALLEARVEVMTPQQLVNHLAFLERRGALQVPSILAEIRLKLAHGVRESRVQDMKTLVALSRVDAPPELADQVLAMTQERLRRRGRITAPTARRTRRRCWARNWPGTSSDRDAGSG